MNDKRSKETKVLRNRIKELVDSGKLDAKNMTLGDVEMAYRELKEEQPDKEPEKLRCPVCNGTDIRDASTWKNNGILGPGYSSWKTSNTRCCNGCGVMFKPVKKNRRNES